MMVWVPGKVMLMSFQDCMVKLGVSNNGALDVSSKSMKSQEDSSGIIVCQTPAHIHHRPVTFSRRSEKVSGCMLKLDGICGFMWI